MSQTPYGDPDVTRSIVAVMSVSGNRQPVGVGFAIANDQVLTCAHVVNAAIGRPLTEQTPPGRTAHPPLIVPLCDDEAGHPGSPDGVIVTDVLHWSPPASEGFGAGDIACLRASTGGRPSAVAPVALADPRDSQGAPLDLFGYPANPPRPMGAWTRCRLVNRVAGGLWQLDQDPHAALNVQPGFSGSPLWDSRRGVVVGMLVVAATPGSAALNAYAIPSGHLLAACPTGATEENLRRSTHSSIDDIRIYTRHARAAADVDVKLTPQECLDVCYKALSTMRLNRISVNARARTLEARTKMQMRTWGDKISVAVDPRPFGAHVLVSSEPLVRATLTNYGLARSNVVRVLVALSDALEES